VHVGGGGASAARRYPHLDSARKVGLQAEKLGRDVVRDQGGQYGPVDVVRRLPAAAEAFGDRAAQPATKPGQA